MPDYRNYKCTNPCGGSMITSNGQRVDYGDVNWSLWCSAHTEDHNYPDQGVLNHRARNSWREMDFLDSGKLHTELLFRDT